MVEPLFENRRDAGRRLAARLQPSGTEDPIVIALPRGGVPVGYEVAAALGTPLDVLVVRKVGAPMQPEYGVGAIAGGGDVLLNTRALDLLRVGDEDIRPVVDREFAELHRRVARYRHDRAPENVEGRTVLLVDDGIAPDAATHISPAALFAEEIGRVGLEDATVVAPDRGALERCVAVAQAARLQAPVAHLEKQRTRAEITHGALVGRVGPRAVVVDDILDTGGTLLQP